MAHATTVLLVEDEVLISHLVASSLSEQGFIVHESATSDEALDYMKSGGDVDVLFTDVNLPGDMNGAELAVLVRQMRPDLPIVYASGLSRPTSAHWCRARCSCRSRMIPTTSAHC